MADDGEIRVSADRTQEVAVVPSQQNYGGIALAGILVVLAVVLMLWLFGSADETSTATTGVANSTAVTDPGGENIAPVDSSSPQGSGSAATSVPADDATSESTAAVVTNSSAP